jgi:23S rRNA (cytosine1962-C5)-methyltransferase
MKKTITLRKNEDHRIRGGHLWVFSNEIREMAGTPVTGDIVLVRDNGGVLLGTGFYNAHSLIAVRMLSRTEEEITSGFLRTRIEQSLALRERLFPGADAFRAVHGESDFLPGLIVDKYGEFLSVQVLSAGMEQRLTEIYDLLGSIFTPKGIIERNDLQTRALEGLEQRMGVVRGEHHPVDIREHDLTYTVNLLDGQKTGFFLDQRMNRFYFRNYTRDCSVLDCFCNEGGFALNAAAGGAASVIGIDISEPAVLRARENATRNSLSGTCSFESADAFEYLKSSAEKGITFDVINLDPPSFAKNKKGVIAAKRGYKDLHAAAIKALKPGGMLATASCSHHITGETFLDIINETAIRAGRSIQLLEWHGASPDHPVLPSMAETAYLKFGIFRVM